MPADRRTTQKVSIEGSLFLVEFDPVAPSALLPRAGSAGGRRRSRPTGGDPLGAVVAVLLAAALLAEQYFYGGAMRPVFALPGYGLLALTCLISAAKVAFSRQRPSLPIGLPFWTAAGGLWLLWRCAGEPTPWEGMLLMRLICAAMAAYLVTSLALTRLRWRLLLLALLLLGALVQAGLGAAQVYGVAPSWLTPEFSEQLRQWYGEGAATRARGFYLNPNHLGWLLTLATLMGLSFAALGRGGWIARLGFLSMAAAAGYALLLTASRGAALALAVGLAVYAVLGLRAVALCGHRRRWLLRGVFAVLVAAVAWSAFWAAGRQWGVGRRLAGGVADLYRRDLWPVAWEQAAAHPWQGGGAGSFRYRAREARPPGWRLDDLYVHNDWLQAAAEFGLPVLGWLLAVVALHGSVAVGSCLDAFRRLESGRWPGSNQVALLVGGVAVLAAWSLHAGFDFNLQVPANALLAAALLGMLASHNAHGRQTRAGWWRIPAVAALLGLGIALPGLSATARGEWHHLKAENALLRGDPRTARLEAARGLADAPANPSLWRTEGEAWLALAKEEHRAAHYAQAVRAFRQLVALAPLDDFHHLRLAEAQLGQGNGAEALATARQAMALAPGFPVAYEIAGRSCETLGRYEEAGAYYHEALARGAPAAIRERIRNVAQ
ncbi:MAG TPA: O-antigen ligase family protein [Chthoniobacteraceae bacterium]|nr:O-antigen ligase family protein [Chthoniobacteraceae bacterium]